MRVFVTGASGWIGSAVVYAGDGSARRTAVHVEVIGRHLDVPVRPVPDEELDEHFGFLAMFLGTDSPATAARTRELTGWTPTEPGLIEDLDKGHYFAPGANSKYV